MPKFNVDEDKKLVEPIELTIGGKEYVINEISFEFLDEVTEMAKSKDPEIRKPSSQLAKLLGTDVKEFQGMDIRKVNAAIKFVTGAITDSLDNPSKNS